MDRPISEWDVRQVCGRMYFDRGKDYWKSRKVLQLQWDQDAECVLAEVSGSGRNRYEVDIQLLPEEPVYRFDGECTCPVGANCKHVAAVMLEWLQRTRTPAAPKPVAPKAQDDLDLWLAHAASLKSGGASPASRHVSGQELLFILSSQTYRDNTRVFLNSCRSKRLKSGAWGKTSSYNLAQLGGYYSYPPGWVTAEDVEIAELAKKSSSTGSFVIEGDIGPVLLSRLLRTGRCFWQSEQAPALQPGPARKAVFEWQPTDDGGSRLHIGLEGLDGPWVPVPTDPPWYVDVHGNSCGAVLQPLDAALFHALCHLPPVAEEKLASLGLFLSSRVPKAQFPLPGAAEIQVWEQPPVPVLRLMGQTNPKGQVSHLARLEFEYGPVRLSPLAGGEDRLTRIEGKDWLIRRDWSCELSCVHLLVESGFVPAEVAGLGQQGHCDLVFASDDLSRLALDWRRFLQRLDALAEQGWKIEKGEDFILRFDRVQSLDVCLEDEQRGWFDIGLDIRHGDLTIPLIPLVLQWLERGMPDEPLMFFLGDGAWLEIPPEVVAPVVNTLVELHHRPDLDSRGRMRLGRQQAHSLAALQERISSQGVGIHWQGGERVRALGEKLRGFEGIAPVEPPGGLAADLRPYQRQGLAWLQFLREYGFGGILADDMGLGKTLQTLAHLLVEKQAGRLEHPALVAAPTSVLGNWRREAERFAPELRVLVLHGKGRDIHYESIKDYDLILTSYALLVRDMEVLQGMKFHSLILDEAQFVKNPKSKTAQAACAINAANRLCLTGTPLENHLGELWSLFHFLMPGFLGQETVFNSLFRHPVEKRGDGERRSELVRRIHPFVLRRDKKQVASELPPKTEIIRTVELPDGQRRLYESIRTAMAGKVSALLQEKGLARSHIEMLDALLKLRQVCCDPRLLKLESARKTTQSAKLELLAEMLAELVEEGRKVILFSQFTSMLALIEVELARLDIPYVKLTGQTRKRQEVIDLFQQGSCPLFLVSLKAGGTGLNLTAADTVIHYDPWWNPAVERQATDRAYRIGQDKPVFVYKLVAENTVEEKILLLQQRKQALAEGIYRKPGEGGELSSLSAEEILDLFS